MKRTASAIWTGDLQKGKGTLSTGGGVLNQTPYSFTSRFENGKGTNPEELIGAAHAGCFTMALAARLSKAGFVPDQLTTQATVNLEQVNGNWTLTAVHLEVSAKVPKIEPAKFEELVQDAKTNCVVSRALNAKITLTSQLT